MENNEYLEVSYREELLQELANINDSITDMSGLNAAMNDQLILIETGLEDVLTNLAEIIKNGSASASQAAISQIAASNKSVLSELDMLNYSVGRFHQDMIAALKYTPGQTSTPDDTAQAQKTSLASIIGNFFKKGGELQKITEQTNVNNVNFSSLMNFLSFMMTKKKLEEFDKGVDQFNVSLDKLSKGFEGLLTVGEKLKPISDTIKDISITMSKGADIFANAGKNMLLFSLGIAVLITAASFVDGDTIVKGLLAMAGAIIILGGALIALQAIMARLKRSDDAKRAAMTGPDGKPLKLGGSTGLAVADDMLQLGKAMLVMALALAAFALIVTYLPLDKVLMGAGLMIVIALAFAGAAKLAGPAAKDLGFALAGISIALIAFAFSLVFFQKLINQVDFGTVLKATGLMLALGLAVRMMGKGSKDIIYGVIAMGAIVIALLALAYVLPLYEKVTIDQMQTVGLALAGILAAAFILGKIGKMGKDIVMGTIAVVAVLLALVAARFIIDMYADVTVDSLAMPGLVLAAILASAAIVAAIGMIGIAPIIMGVVAIAAIVGSLYLTAKVIREFDGISIEQLAVPGLVMAGLLVAATACAGIGLVAPLALAGAAVTAALAGALLIASKAFVNFAIATKMFSTADLSKVGSTVGNMIGLVKDIAKKFDTLSKSEIKKLSQVAEPVLKLATAIAIMANTMSAVANNTFTEYELKNGKMVPVSVRRMQPSDYDAFGTSVSKLITSITTAVVDAQTKLTSKDFKAGLDSLSKLPKIVTPMIEIAKNWDVLKKAEFDGFGLAVSKLIVAMEPGMKVLTDNIQPGKWGEPGQGTGLFGIVGYKAGTNTFLDGLKSLEGLNNIVAPMIEIGKNWATLKDADFSGFGTKVTELVDNSITAVSKLGATTGLFGGSDFKDGLKTLAEVQMIIDPMKKVAAAMPDIEGTNFTQFGQKVDWLVQGLIKPMKAAKDSDIDKGLAKLARLSNLVEPMKQIHGIYGDFAKTEQFEVLMQTAAAIDTLSNINLYKAAAIQNNIQKELYKQLTLMLAELKGINTNTKPQPKAMSNVVKDKNGVIDFAATKAKLDAMTEVGDQQIYEVLNLIYETLQQRR